MSFPTFSSDYTLTYLAEGAANVVYRIAPPPSSPGTLSASDSVFECYSSSTPPPTDIPPLTIDPLYEDKLLRLRKASPTATSVFAAQESFEKQIAPLLPSECLVEQTLIRLPRGLTSKYNAELQRMELEGTRSSKRRATYLADEEYGSLVTDMSSAGNPDVLTVEFKPKWLAQSPSAPNDAKRCRTCALRLARMSAGGKDENSDQALRPKIGAFCPLRLMASRAQDHVVVAQQITSDVRCPAKEQIVAQMKLIEWIVETPLLKKLRNLQVELDEKGVLAVGSGSTEAEKEKLTVAMTLRDCTAFLKIQVEGNARIEARIGDLDIKSETKLESWAALEKSLIGGGWYTENIPGMENMRPCILENSEARNSIAGKEHRLLNI